MKEKIAPQEEKIPLHSRIWVALADAGSSTLGGLAGSGVLTYYFTRWRGLDPQLAAIVWLLFAVWNACNDPLFGYISDRTKSRLGRRIPYIRYGAPLYALAFIACWIDWPGTGSNQTAMFIQMLLLLFFFDTLYTSIATAIFIMPYEMAVSNKARSSIYIWKIIFQVFPIAVPLVVIPVIQPGPGEDATLFRLVMTAFGIVIGLIILFSTFFYKEKHFQQEEKQMPFFRSLRECLSNFSFLIFEIMSFTIIYINTGLMQGVLYYFDEIKVDRIPLFAALGIGIVSGVFLWVKKREGWGIKKSVRLMCLVFAVGCVVLLLLGRVTAAAAVGFFLFGIGFSGAMFLIPIMMGDTIDADEHRTGLRREGMYAGVNSFVTKPAISIAQAVFLNIITFFGYDQSLGKGLQSASAQTGILTGWLLVPALLFIVSFLLLHRYPLAGERWEGIKKELAEVHREKERKYLEKLGD
jgi:glycoside/pentoside/hexuronide:cation symporter, GPH family